MNPAAFTRNPTLAQLAPGKQATWHIVRCHPGHESMAAGYLAGRRFGIYVPLEDQWRDRRPEEVARQTPLLPGYVFVFLFGLAENVSRVLACPGVTGFLAQPGGHPVVVVDGVIKQIMDIEWRQYLHNLPRSFFRRRRRGEQWEIRRWSTPNRGFADPNPEARVSALHQALGLSA